MHAVARVSGSQFLHMLVGSVDRHFQPIASGSLIYSLPHALTMIILMDTNNTMYVQFGALLLLV